MNNNTKDWLKNVIGLWVMVALAIVLLALLSKEAKGQRVLISTAPLVPTLAAITTCSKDGDIVIIISDFTPSVELGHVMAHEMQHVLQIQRHEGGCFAFLEHFKASPDFRIKMEFEAYCKDLEQLVREGGQRDLLMERLTNHLQRAFVPNLPIEEIRKLMPCGKPIAPRDGTFVVPP